MTSPCSPVSSCRRCGFEDCPLPLLGGHGLQLRPGDDLPLPGISAMENRASTVTGSSPDINLQVHIVLKEHLYGIPAVGPDLIPDRNDGNGLEIGNHRLIPPLKGLIGCPADYQGPEAFGRFLFYDMVDGHRIGYIVPEDIPCPGVHTVAVTGIIHPHRTEFTGR